MNEKKAKKLRKVLFGGNPIGKAEYVYVNGTRVNSSNSDRGVYIAHKRWAYALL